VIVKTLILIIPGKTLSHAKTGGQIPVKAVKRKKEGGAQMGRGACYWTGKAKKAFLAQGYSYVMEAPN